MARRRMQTQQDEARPEEEDTSRLQEETAAVMSRPADLWLESQAVLFRHFDDMARRWLDRRREALDATRDSIDEMRRTTDMTEMFRIQQDWISGSMRRLAADLSELSETALTLTQTAAARFGRSAEGMAHETEQIGRDLLSAAGSKPGEGESEGEA